MSYAISGDKPTLVLFHLNTQKSWEEKVLADSLAPIVERFAGRIAYLEVDVSDELAAQDLCDDAVAPVRSLAVFPPGGGSAWAWSGPSAAELVVARLEELLKG